LSYRRSLFFVSSYCLKRYLDRKSPGGRCKRYPAYEDIQKRIERRYGPPTSARTYAEERQRRSDRLWQGKDERMSLQCFQDSGPGWQAEAVVIVPTGR
jgi:hypothetical protein